MSHSLALRRPTPIVVTQLIKAMVPHVLMTAGPMGGSTKTAMTGNNMAYLCTVRKNQPAVLSCQHKPVSCLRVWHACVHMHICVCSIYCPNSVWWCRSSTDDLYTMLYGNCFNEGEMDVGLIVHVQQHAHPYTPQCTWNIAPWLLPTQHRLHNLQNMVVLCGLCCLRLHTSSSADHVYLHCRAPLRRPYNPADEGPRRDAGGYAPPRHGFESQGLEYGGQAPHYAYEVPGRQGAFAGNSQYG